MKAYLASSFALKDKVARISDALTGRGIQTTVRWWERDAKERLSELDDDAWYSHEMVKRICGEDLAGIDSADALVLVCPDGAPAKFNGANVELGYALAKGKPLYSIGKLDRSALYASVVRCRDVDELAEKLSRR